MTRRDLHKRDMNVRRSLLLVGACTAAALTVWWPLDFAVEAVRTVPSRTAGWGIPFLPEVRDILVNVSIFVPIGAILYRRAVHSIAALALFGGALGVALEVGQVFLPARILSVTDPIGNLVGVLMGGVSVKHGPPMLARFARWKVNPLLVAAASVVWGSGAFFWLQSAFADFDTWSATYPLQIGNEATGDRLWCGEVRDFAFVVDGQIWSGESFAFAERTATVPTESGCQSGSWLQAATPPTELVEAVRRSRRFRIELSAQPASLAQRGPARIISISMDTGRRNLTIGQDGRDLVVRIRRRWAGLNGDRPAYRIPDVFRIEEAVDITVDAGSDSTTVTVGGVRLLDRHDVARQWWVLLLSSIDWRSGPWEAPLALLFWTALLGPIGVLVGAAAAGRARPVSSTAALGAGAALVAWAVLLGLGVRIGWDALLWMPAAMTFSTLIGRRVASLPSRGDLWSS